MIDPNMLASLMQMATAKSQGLGAGLASGDSEGWGDFFGGSVLGGYLTGRAAKKKKKSMARRFKKALGATEAIQGASLGNQEAMTKLATKQQLGGYDAARREADRIGRSSRQSALDRESQLGARASQGLASSGLGSTTMGANLQRGIASDTNRQLQGINEGLAGMFGDLALGRAGAEAQGTQALNQYTAQRGDLASQLAQMRLLGGATLGSTGTFDPGQYQNYRFDSTTPFMEGMGSMMGGMGGGKGGGQMGGMDPQMLQWLFGGKPGGM